MDPHAFLALVRTRLRNAVLADGSARLISALVALAAGAVAIDYCWEMPGAMRALMLAAIVGVGFTMARKRLLRPLSKALDDAEVARFCEARLPALDGRLFSTVSGITMNAHDAQVMADALRQDSVRTLVPAATVPRNTLIAIAALAAILAGFLFFSQIMRDGLTRLFLPFGSTEWTRSSSMKLTFTDPRPLPVYAADERVMVDIARLTGNPATVTVTWTTDQGSESQVLPGLQGPWQRSLSLPLGTQTITVKSGDSKEEKLTALIVERPRLAAAATEIIPPAYTGLPAMSQAMPAATVLPGSVVRTRFTFATQPKREVIAASVDLPDQSAQTLIADAKAGGYPVEFTVRTAGVVRIHAHDRDNIGLNPSPTFDLGLAIDRAPVVSLDGLARVEKVVPTAVLPLRVRAEDDFGLASARLLLTKRMGESATASCPAPTLADPKGRKAMTFPAELALSGLVAPGDRLGIAGEARDRNDVTGPGIGRSDEATLEVVTVEELHKDLESALRDIAASVATARDELNRGMVQEGKLPAQARNSAMRAVGAEDQVRQVLRRIDTNRLPQPERWAAAATAAAALNGAQKELVKAANDDLPAAKRADSRFDEAERALKSLLADSDAARQLADLIGRQRQLNADTAKALAAALTAPSNDPKTKDLMQNLGENQAKIAEALRAIESQIAESQQPGLDEAKAMVRDTPPSTGLQKASGRLSNNSERTLVPGEQKQATSDMEKLLEKLRGAEQAGDTAKKLEELAEKQGKIADALENGAPLAKAEKEQEDLRAETEKATKRMDDGEAKSTAQAAQGAQKGAQQSAGSGNRSDAAKQARAAQALLKKAAEKAKPKAQSTKNDDKDKDKPKSTIQVLKLLRELRDKQETLIVKAAKTHETLQEGTPTFAQNRDIGELGNAQSELQIIATEMGLKELAKMPIARTAMERVVVAMQLASAQLSKPALGQRGMRLMYNALAEIERILAIVDGMPAPEQEEDKKGGDGGGGGGGGGQQPPFPPAAELGLLAAMQAETAQALATNRPVDVADMQGKVREIIEMYEQGVKPGRVRDLFERAGRAVRSAHARLGDLDKGATTRAEMEVAEAAIRRIIAEAKAQKGQGQGQGEDDGQKPRSAPKNDPSAGESQGGPSNGGNPAGSPGTPGEGQAGNGQAGQSGQPGEGQKPGEGKPGEGKPGQGQPGTGSSASGNPADQSGNGDPTKTATAGDLDNPSMMRLPPELRRQIESAREQGVTPAVLEVYQRYLENLAERP